MAHKEKGSGQKPPHPHARRFNTILTNMAGRYGMPVPQVELFDDVKELLKVMMSEGRLQRGDLAEEAQRQGISVAELTQAYLDKPPFWPSWDGPPDGAMWGIEDVESGRRRNLVYVNPKVSEGENLVHTAAPKPPTLYSARSRRHLGSCIPVGCMKSSTRLRLLSL